MIVQCTNCRARFRVADDKVPERGVKVRCTKCATVFKVTRADAVDQKSPLARDQFGLDAGAPTTGRHLTFEPGEPTPSPAYVPPARASMVPPAVSLTYGAASPHQSLDFDLGPPPPRAPAPPPQPAYQQQPVMQQPAFQPPPNPIDLALEAAMSAADPFAALGATPATPPPRTPSLYAPPQVPVIPPSALPAAPSDDPFADPFGAGGVASGLGPQQLSDPFAELSAPPIAPPDPKPTTAKTRTAQLAAQQPHADAAFGQLPPARELTDPFAALDQPPGASLDALGQPKAGAGLGAGEFEFGEATRSHQLELDTGGRAASESAPQPTEVARLALQKAAPGGDEKAKEDPKQATRQKMRREVASAVFNAISAFVVGFTAIVVLATIRAPRPVTVDDLGFPMVWLALGYDDGKADTQLRVTGVHSGTYETHAGGELFYVEGTALNASSASHEALHVAVELVKGDQILGRVESMANLQASPEELFALDSRKNDDLQRLLALRTRSLEVAARGQAPFIAVFPLGAREVEGADVRLSVLDGVPAGLKPLLQPKEPAPQPAPEQPVAQQPADPAPTASQTP